jgi:hypothetical protein
MINHILLCRALMAPVLALALLAGTVLKKAEAAATAISSEAKNEVAQMGKTLSTEGFSFQMHTIREYMDENGQPLHIFHAISLLVRRPDRLSVIGQGEDGTTKLAYDGKILTLYVQRTNEYLSVPISGTLEDVLREAATRLNMDFPLADLLANAPDQAFLQEVVVGNVVDTVPIEGVPSLHLFFMQPPGIELELWTEKNERAVPRRLIVTYRSLPGEPRFIAEMSDWKLGLKPSDAEFSFQPPQGATRMEAPK